MADTPEMLTLEVVNDQKAMLGAAWCKSFDGRGGTIGRTTENDWVLPAAGVSRRHATIRYVNGLYFIEDNSRNGITVNGEALQANEPAILSGGDRIVIDQFEIAARIDAEGAAAPSLEQEGARVAAPPRAPILESPADDLADLIGGGGALGARLDPLDALGPPKETAPARPQRRGWNHTPGIGDSFTPPGVEAERESGAIPDDWLADAHDAVAPESGNPVRPAKLREARPRSGSGTDMAEVLAGAGLAGDDLSPEMAQEFGRVLRIVVEGVLEVLRARAEIKSEFRLPVTRAQRSENNPLKFAANVEDALHSLLVRRNPAYLGTVAAFEDAFEDIRHHQLAMLAGMRAAYENLLGRFDPARLQREFDKMPAELFIISTGHRNWDRYEAWFKQLARDPGDSFQTLFGEAFARAYNAQLAELKQAPRRKGAGR